ncbi:CAF17-like 4Fe-4S cluster assembly/insertion protein YgfZ [Lysobacter solisilvae (ex Woo and Kim 2020)]|nr:folate-binding protein [Lysobacter terrestris]
MNDLKVLAPGHWQWSGWLTPKGRVVALFALLKFDEETLWLLLPDADPVTFAAALQRFVFRSKLAIAVRDDLRVEGAFTAPTQARGDALSGDPASSVELDLGADGGTRTLRILPASTASHDPAWMARWAAFDLEHGVPRLPASQSDHWTPQQLSLERLNAFSVKKGCYPGQEIVARTHFLGKVKRGLALLEAASAVHAGDDLRASDAPLGHLVASANADGRHLALAVVPLEREPARLTVTGEEARELPLRTGLAR